MNTLTSKSLALSLLLAGAASAQYTPGTVDGASKLSATSGGIVAPALGDKFGAAVANIGDLNGDGHDDLAVGSPFAAQGGTSSGELRILFLDGAGSVIGEQTIASGVGGFTGLVDDNDEFGASVTAIGDVNGDGVTDLAVGAPGDDKASIAPVQIGSVWILFMNADGTVSGHNRIGDDTTPFLSLTTLDDFGAAVANIGDVDGNGVDDLAVGAPGNDDAAFSAGAIHVLRLDSTGAAFDGLLITEGFGGATIDLDNTDGFGTSIATVGPARIAVGAPFDDDATGNAGAIYVLTLGPGGTVVDENKIIKPITGIADSSDFFGMSIARVEDVDDDGFDDLLVGATGADFQSGGFFSLFLDGTGNLGGWEIASKGIGRFDALADFDGAGASLAVLGDLNGDGDPEVAVGATGDDDGGEDAGALWIIDVAGKWVDAGSALAGTEGEPTLTGSGKLEAGFPVAFEVTGALPFGTAALVVGFDAIEAPFKGGTLVPDTDLIVPGLPLDGVGGITIGANWPAGFLPDTTIHAQFWVTDAAGPQGFAATNAIAGTTP